MAGKKKWIGPARSRMERKGTVGSLRAIAQKKGLLSGPEDTLTEQDLDRLAAMAKRMGGKEGLALTQKVNFARNVRKSKR